MLEFSGLRNVMFVMGKINWGLKSFVHLGALVAPWGQIFPVMRYNHKWDRVLQLGQTFPLRSTNALSLNLLELVYHMQFKLKRCSSSHMCRRTRVRYSLYNLFKFESST